MPGTPTGGDIYVSRVLTNLSIAYFQGTQDFIADKVFPPIPVDHQFGQYYTYDKGDWLKTRAQKRAPRTESAGTSWNVGRENYSADVNAIHVDIADQDRANQDSVFNLDRDATNLVTHDIMMRRELDFVEAYFGTGIWTEQTEQQGVAAAPGANQFLQWNNSSSTPIEDIEEQRILMQQRTGLRPNVLVLGPQVYSVFKNHPEFIERIKYSERAIVTTELMAALLDVDRVLVPGVVTNDGEDGAFDDADNAFAYGKSALLAYAASSPGLMTPSAGYSFEWTGYLGAETRGTRVKKFRMEPLAADRVEVESAYDFKVVSNDLGVFFRTAVA